MTDIRRTDQASPADLTQPDNPTGLTWPELSARVRDRDDWTCRCDGACGQHDGACDAEHGELHPVGDAHDIGRAEYRGGKPWRTATIVTGYSDDDPTNWHLENLLSLCLWCKRALEEDDQRKVETRKTRPKRARPGYSSMEKPDKTLLEV